MAADLSDVDREEIRALMARWEAIWRALDYEALRTLWAADEAEPWWLPEEAEAPLVGWPAVEAYWDDCRAIIARFGLRTWDLRIKALGPDVAVAMLMMKWTAEIVANAARPIGGEVKVSVVLRRCPEGWRFVHYMEAALGPLPYVRAAYRAQAEPGLLGD